MFVRIPGVVFSNRVPLGLMGLALVLAVGLSAAGVTPPDGLGAMLNSPSRGEKITREIYDEQGRLADRFTVIDEQGVQGRHTLEIKIGGARMQGIVIRNMELKPEDPAKPKVVLKIDAGSKHIVVDRLILRDVHAAELAIEDSEFLDVFVSNIRADGASTHIDVSESPLTRRGFSGYDRLPVWKIDASSYDVVEIEATGKDAHVEYILIENVNVPGKLSIKDIQANELIIEDSTIGRGDGLAAKDFIFDDLTVERFIIEGVIEAPVDNLFTFVKET